MARDSLKAGSLRHYVQVLALHSEQDDSSGVVVESYLPAFYFWADFRMISGREYVSSGAVQSSIIATVRTRYNSMIDDTMQLQFNGRTFKIESILSDTESGQEWMTMPCSEVIQR